MGADAVKIVGGGLFELLSGVVRKIKESSSMMTYVLQLSDTISILRNEVCVFVSIITSQMVSLSAVLIFCFELKLIFR